MAKKIKMAKPTKHEHEVLLSLVEMTIAFQSAYGTKCQISKAKALAAWLGKYREAYDTATERG